MIYETPDTTTPKIFLLELHSLKWQFLADTFAEYQRMSIAHLGLPYWELCFSSCGLPSWTEQLFLLLAPHLLEKNDPRRSRCLPNSMPSTPYNQLDLTVFRTKPKCNAGGPSGQLRPLMGRSKHHFWNEEDTTKSTNTLHTWKTYL